MMTSESSDYIIKEKKKDSIDTYFVGIMFVGLSVHVEIVFIVWEISNAAMFSRYH